MPGKTLLIVQHMAREGPGGHLRAALAEASLPYHVLEIWHEPLPSLETFAGLIVLGGSPNVDEEELYPYLRPLKSLIRETIASGRAYLGFCLGHQLLGHVLGCRVGPLPRKSVGFIPGELSPAGRGHPLFDGLPDRFPLFKWHGQGVLPPLSSGLHILVKSAAAPVEALGMQNNSRVVGLQFDNHAAPDDVAEWLEHDHAWVLDGTGVDPAALRQEAGKQEAAIGLWFRRFMGNFCEVTGLT